MPPVHQGGGVGGGGGDNFHFMVSTTSDLISRDTCRQLVERQKYVSGWGGE